ncbi:MAG TPA: hypothetical protein VNS79_12520 [Sphingobium sp.]|nr:hypothetical protein [Sphingobium sp.]
MELSHRMLLDLYGTVECDSRWTVMLDQLCADLGMRSAVVQALEHRDGRFCEQWTARDTRTLSHAALHDRYVNRPDNPRFDTRRVGRISGEVGSDQRLFDPSDPLHSKLRHRLQQSGLGDAIWASFPINNRRRFTLILHREPGDSRDVEAAEERFLHILLPHLKQAVRLNTRVTRSEERRQGFAAALDQLRTGVVLCTGALDVEWYNQAAGRILAASPALYVADGQLRCRGRQDGQRLRDLAAAVAQGRQAGATVALDAGSGEAVHVRIVQLEDDSQASRWPGAPTPIALFLSHSTVLPRLDATEIAALFSLTPAEARLAAALASGTTLADFAAERGIALGTARIQLKQALAKTRSGRQAELVRKLSGSVAAYMIAP